MINPIIVNTPFLDLFHSVRQIDEARIVGHVRAVAGLSLTVAGLERAIGIGQRCRVLGRRGAVMGEVVGFGASGTRVLPFGTWDGVSAGDPVEVLAQDDMIHPDDSWIGRVVDALGRPVGPAAGFCQGEGRQAVKAVPPKAMDRRRVGAKIATRVKVMDIFTPLCRGQRMGIFAGSGVGKSTLMAMLVRNAEADVIVVALVGERGREVQDFIQDDLGPEGMARAVVVVATGDEAPLMRRQAAWTATAVAEHFRDAGKQVLLLVDSVTRFAMAQREIGLSGGEPPTAKGYPPTVFSELPLLLERAGPGTAGQGDITALYTVLVDGDDMNEPIADAVRGILDGHVVLDRRIAEQDRYPAVNIQRSISRMLPDCHDGTEFRILQEARRALGRYADMEDLIRVGAYRTGADPQTDAAIRFFEGATRFLSQRKHEAADPAEAFARLDEMLQAAGVGAAGPGSVPGPGPGPGSAPRGG